MIILGDLHLDARLGNRKSVDLLNEKLDKLIDIIYSQDKVVFLGDYFNPANPDNGEREKLSEIIMQITIEKIFLVGNHDKDKYGNCCLSAIRPFIIQNNGIIVDDYYEMGEYCFISYTLDFQHIENIIKTTKCKYIIGHFSFEYENRGRIFKGELEYKPEYDNKIFILGHIHKSQN